MKGNSTITIENGKLNSDQITMDKSTIDIAGVGTLIANKMTLNNTTLSLSGIQNEGTTLALDADEDIQPLDVTQKGVTVEVKDTLAMNGGTLRVKEGSKLITNQMKLANDSTVIHDRLPLSEVPPLTEKEYFTCGCTALLDAVGGAIHHIGNIHKYARREDVPEKTMFIITTDGYENASHRYDYERVRRMIERQKEKYGWEFLFLGANIDAAKEAARFGIGADRSVNYKCDEAGTALNYEVISEAVCSVRAARPLSADWKRRIDEDVQKRGR